MKTLKNLYKDWEKWVSTADKSEDGWQSYYPAWDDLMNAAISAMTQQPLDAEALEYIDKCWAISEETEDLACYAENHIDECWDVLCHLAKSEYPDTRWQVYSVLGFAGPRAESLLRNGLLDSDDYCKRRALLSLARLQPDDARQLASQFLQDADPYMRLASIEMVRVPKDAKFIHQMQTLLLQDPDEYVRKAALTLPSTETIQESPGAI